MKIERQNLYNNKIYSNHFTATPCEIIQGLERCKTSELFPSRKYFIEKIVRFFEDIETEAQIQRIAPKEPLKINIGTLNPDINPLIGNLQARLDIVENGKLTRQKLVTLTEADKYINTGSFLTDPTKESVKHLAGFTRGSLIKQLLQDTDIKNPETIDLFV